MASIHLVIHTHWDREWYLTYQQFRFKLVALIDHLLTILDDDINFSSFLLDGQAIILEDYLQIRPERELDLIRHIQNGRLFIGPWYVSPDEFLISAESHIRNLLEGERICKKLGGKMAVGYLPDTFGHIGQMPQILNGFDIDTACVWRGLDDQPIELDWKAPDGSCVLLSYLRDSYSNAASLTPSDDTKFNKQINEMCDSLSSHSVTGQILLMNGTDHMEPSKDITTALFNYQHKKQDNSLSISNLPYYFASVRSSLTRLNINLPVVYGELRSPKHSALLPNVLSTRITLKQRNNACETRLLKWVEPLNVWIKLLSGIISSNRTQITTGARIFESQDALIRYAWKQLMQCHPHDSICGTSIDQVSDEMIIRFDQVDQLSDELVNHTLKQICENIDTVHMLQQDHAENYNFLSSIVVFNPNDCSQTGLIRENIKIDANYSSFQIFDKIGNSIPFEQTGSGIFELISMKLDKKTMKQALGMIHEGNIAGMSVREFKITTRDSQVEIHATLSDHAAVDMNKWNQGNEEMERLFADEDIKEFIVHANSDPETEVTFIAADIPQHGYSTYWICGILKEARENGEPPRINPLLQRLLPILNKLTQSPIATRLFQTSRRGAGKRYSKIENEFFAISAHHGSEGIEILDKRTNYIFKDVNKFIDGGDCGDVYNYSPPEENKIIAARIIRTEVEQHISSQQLTITYALEIPSSLADTRKLRSHNYRKHTIISTLTLVSGVPRIDVHTEIENQSSDHRLRVHFPSAIRSSFSFHDGHFEIVKRSIGLPNYDSTWEEQPRPEVPQCDFSVIADENLSLTIANRGLPEVEAYKSEDGFSGLAITLLRCVGWLSRDDITTRKGHAGPMNIPTPDAQMIGKHSFEYSIIPGDNNWRSSIQQADSFVAPLIATVTSIHRGVLPQEDKFVENQNPDFKITSIKSSENDRGVIVRGFNNSPAQIEVHLKPPRSIKQAYLVKLDETVIESLELTPDGYINITVDGNRIITILFTP